MLHAVAAALAVAAPIFGTGPRQHATSVLDPVSLQPVAASPVFPKSTDQIETSPDGARYAAGFRRGLKIFDAATGDEVAHVRVATYDRVVSWLTDDRIAIVKRGKPTTVRIVSVSEQKVVHREVLRARLSDTARVGERQVTLNAVKTGDEQTLSVFDADGTLERTVALPGMTEGDLRSRPVAGRVLVLNGASTFYDAVDIETGTVERHELDIPEGVEGQWLEPQTGDALALGYYGLMFVVNADDTTTRIRGVGDIGGAGDGFLSFDDEGTVPLRVLDATGETVWQTEADPLDAQVFGDRVYTGGGYDDVKLREYDLATGTLRRTMTGRAGLFEASAGRVDVPFFTSGAINED